MTSPPTTAPARPHHRSALVRPRRPTVAATAGEEGSSASTVAKEDGLLTSDDVGGATCNAGALRSDHTVALAAQASQSRSRAWSPAEEAAVHVGSVTGRSGATGQGAAPAARREDGGVGGSLSAEARILVGLQGVTARPVPLVVARGLDRAGAHAAAWLATAALGACVDARRRADWVQAGVAVLAAH